MALRSHVSSDQPKTLAASLRLSWSPSASTPHRHFIELEFAWYSLEIRLFLPFVLGLGLDDLLELVNDFFLVLVEGVF